MADGWKDPANWRRVRPGMSKGQVEALLGLPAKEDGGQWYYLGSVAGSGEVAGYVCFISEQVNHASPPVFESRQKGSPNCRKDVGSRFSVGDSVRVKSFRGPLMTVVHEGWVHEDRTYVRCLWFDSRNRVRESAFRVEILEVAQGQTAEQLNGLENQ